MDYVYTEKEDEIIEKIEEIILGQVKALGEAEKPLTLKQCDGFTAILAGFDRITRMKGRTPS